MSEAGIAADTLGGISGTYDASCRLRIRNTDYKLRSITLIAVPAEGSPRVGNPYGRFHVRGSLNCDLGGDRVVCGGINEAVYDPYRASVVLRTELFRINCTKQAGSLFCQLPEESICHLARRDK